MGQKVHPEGFRLGVQRRGEKVDFKSSWYSDRDYAELLGEDLKIRDHIEKKLTRAGIADIQIRKAAEQGERDLSRVRRPYYRRARRAQARARVLYREHGRPQAR